MTCMFPYGSPLLVSTPYSDTADAVVWPEILEDGRRGLAALERHALAEGIGMADVWATPNYDRVRYREPDPVLEAAIEWVRAKKDRDESVLEEADA